MLIELIRVCILLKRMVIQLGTHNMREFVLERFCMGIFSSNHKKNRCMCVAPEKNPTLFLLEQFSIFMSKWNYPILKFSLIEVSAGDHHHHQQQKQKQKAKQKQKCRSRSRSSSKPNSKLNPR
jgi:hypothetical protein